MQRIKSQSQSICQPQNHSIASQSRPRSKKTTKGQSSQIICNLNERSKNTNTNAPITEHSMVSIKSSGRPLSGSMKNLRVANNNQTNGKISAQNTSRGGNAQNSAISARILKQIVGYSQRGLSKPKGSYKDHHFHQNKEEPTIKIDLTDEMQNLYAELDKQEEQLRTTLSNNGRKSLQPSQNKQRQTGNSSNQKNKYQKMENRVVQQFSPLNRSPARQPQSKEKVQMKKCTFFNGSYQEEMGKGNSSRIELSNRNISLFNQHKDHEISRLNYETWKNYSSFNDIEDENKLEITNNFIKIASPHHLLSSLEKSTINKVLEVQNMNLVSARSNEIGINKNKKMAHMQGRVLNEESYLLQEKQKLIISLEDANAILQQHYEFKFKEIVQFWKGIIQSQSREKILINQLKQLESTLKKEQQQELVKKTELFQLNRDQICRRKQKEYATKSNKDKYIHEAVSCQEGLRLKLSSKADYEHMILFNEKVVLTGRNSTQDMQQLFTEMFDSKLSKKFALIAKKEIANLSVYDSRLIQDFLKRIQELESLYNKSEGHGVSQSSNHYCSADEQLKVQALVQQIQQITLSLEFTNSKISSKRNEHAQMRRRVQKLKQIIQQYIKSTNEKVSGEYKMVEGYSFDFEILLEQKYAAQFQNYRKLVGQRDTILRKLDQIQKKMSHLRTNKQNCSLIDYNSNAKPNLNESEKSSRMKHSDRKSISFVSTPTRSPLRLDKNESQHQQNLIKIFRKPNAK